MEIPIKYQYIHRDTLQISHFLITIIYLKGFAPCRRPPLLEFLFLPPLGRRIFVFFFVVLCFFFSGVSVVFVMFEFFWALWGPSGDPLSFFGPSRVHFWTLWGPFGPFGPSSGTVFWLILAVWGRIWDPLRPILAHGSNFILILVVLGPFWEPV